MNGSTYGSPLPLLTVVRCGSPNAITIGGRGRLKIPTTLSEEQEKTREGNGERVHVEREGWGRDCMCETTLDSYEWWCKKC